MEIRHTVVIDCSPSDVFAYLTDPDKLSAWQPTTVGIERERTGPLVLGEQFAELHTAFGRTSRSTVEVVELDAPHRFALHIVSGPLPLDGAWSLEPIDGGTRLQFLGHGPIGGFKRLLKPAIARQFAGYHARLKALLEEGRH
jgi:uncharacterized protein YndB with AHSA1/START domain